jgi:DNA-binding LacI/PurR family transcriptional regulator
MARSNFKKTRGRRADRQDHVVELLRRRIVQGEFEPNTRLPNQSELVRDLGVSTITIQRALERLSDEGFVTSQPRRGVFVNSNPPHMVDYCLVFPHSLDQMASQNRFLHGLHHTATQLEAATGKRTTIYCGMEYPTDTQEYHQLVSQVVQRRTAGLIFLSSPWAFAQTPLLTTQGVPRVAIMDQSLTKSVKNVILEPYVGAALDWLKARGVKRLGMLVLPQAGERIAAQWTGEARLRGIEMPPVFVQAVSSDYPNWARRSVELLMNGPADKRPDGLVISDDNLVPYATAGLAGAGISIPVVAHGNFPYLTDCLVDAVRFGPDVRQVLQGCIELIDQTRLGKTSPSSLRLPAVQSE